MSDRTADDRPTVVRGRLLASQSWSVSCGTLHGMTLSSSDLALIRDEVGEQPDDAALQAMAAELGESSWIPTALRILRRRRSALAAGEVRSVALPGGLSISMAGNLASLDKQIDRLERAYAQSLLPPEEACAYGSRVTRQSYR